jgi:hypothetical protein
MSERERDTREKVPVIRVGLNPVRPTTAAERLRNQTAGSHPEKAVHSILIAMSECLARDTEGTNIHSKRQAATLMPGDLDRSLRDLNGLDILGGKTNRPEAMLTGMKSITRAITRIVDRSTPKTTAMFMLEGTRKQKHLSAVPTEERRHSLSSNPAPILIVLDRRKGMTSVPDPHRLRVDG